MKSKSIILISIIILIGIVIGVYRFFPYIYLSMTFIKLPQSYIIKGFNENKTQFENVANFMQSNQHVVINKDYQNKITIEKVGGGKSTPYPVDEQLRTDINKIILNLKYKTIIKDGNTIYFVRRSDLGSSQGVAFSIDGKPPEENQFNKLELLENNWYYYDDKSD